VFISVVHKIYVKSKVLLEPRSVWLLPWAAGIRFRPTKFKWFTWPDHAPFRDVLPSDG